MAVKDFHEMSEFDRMIAWEEGDLDEEERIELFQSLVNSGQAWQLDRKYALMAAYLLEAGLIHPRHTCNRHV